MFKFKLNVLNDHKDNNYFLVLAVLIGILILLPGINSQPFLSQGDHGRDLYSAQIVLQGAVPYRDFWWMYGPLMPYYYALFFQLLGMSIQSVLIGEVFLKLLTGIFIFRALQTVIPSIWSLVGAIWFWMFYPYFFYTYNHTGAIMLFMAVMYYFFQYIDRPRTLCLYAALGCIFLCAFIKINFGFSLLASFVAAVYWADKRREPTCFAGKAFYVSSLILIPMAIIFIYFLLVKGLPLYALRQCFPYIGTDHQYGTNFWNAAGILVNLYTHLKTVGGLFVAGIGLGHPENHLRNGILTMIAILSFVWTASLLFRRKGRGAQGDRILLLMGLLLLFYVTSLHEFVFSGIGYRANWATPFLGLMCFLGLGAALRSSHKALQCSVLLLFFFIFCGQYGHNMKILGMREQTGTSLSLEFANIRLNKSAQWINTVRSVTNYLTGSLGKDETFFALPYDPLYYYLTHKRSPTRQLIFFKYNSIPSEQEQSVIADLENKTVNYILISNRARSPEYGLGAFGETHCQILDRYIKDHFRVVKTFGEWDTPLGDTHWAHSVQIWKRISEQGGHLP